MDKKIISITEGRKRIFEIAENVQKEGAYYMLTDRGAPKVVVMSYEEFDSWQETFEAEKYFPNLKKDLKKADRGIKTGAYKKYALLEDVLAKEGFILADKAKKLYGTQCKVRKKGGKRIKKNS
ncbi:MAG: type II toxin-antitoxin system Phd/YefM family antitoxin [bacterium]